MGTPTSSTVIERVRRYHQKTKRQRELYAQIIDKLESCSISDWQILYRPHDRAIYIMQIIDQLLLINSDTTMCLGIAVKWETRTFEEQTSSILTSK